MKVVTAAQMQAIDQAAQSHGISGYELMTAAGEAIAATALREFNPQHITILCGKGNNAGDGFRAALYFKHHSIPFKLITVEPDENYPEAALKTFHDVIEQGILPIPWTNTDLLRESDLLLDCLLGTGTKGPPREPYASIIDAMNHSEIPILSTDIPSGLRELSPDELPGNIINATVTITIGLPKRCLLEYPGTEHCGKLFVEPINFPPDLLTAPASQTNYYDEQTIAGLLHPRPTDGNKGTFGSVAVYAGSPEYAGAAILVGRAAYRSGCGLVAFFTTLELNPILKIVLPEATSILLDRAANESSAHWFKIEEQLPKYKVLAIGPGLGTSNRVSTIVRTIIQNSKIPMVIDADALNILAKDGLDALHNRADCVLTPHPGEMARLLNCTVAEVQSDRVTAATNLATKLRTNVLLKGASPIIARHDGQTWIVPGACTALAKAGTGDVLTGIIAALIAQAIDPHPAAIIAAATHLVAGKACVQRMGEYAVLAHEVADEAGQQLAKLKNSATMKKYSPT